MMAPNLVARKMSFRFSGFFANHSPSRSSLSPYLIYKLLLFFDQDGSEKSVNFWWASCFEKLYTSPARVLERKGFHELLRELDFGLRHYLQVGSIPVPRSKLVSSIQNLETLGVFIWFSIKSWKPHGSETYCWNKGAIFAQLFGGNCVGHFSQSLGLLEVSD